MADSQEKTEKPTGKRLNEARQRGQIAKSRDLSSVAVLLAGSTALLLSSGFIYDHFKALMQICWGNGFSRSVSSPPDMDIYVVVASQFFTMISAPLMSAFVMAFGISLLQARGFLLSFQAIQPKFGKLNPIQGFQRFFSARSLVELFKSLCKILIIGSIAYAVIRAELNFFMSLVEKEVIEIVRIFGRMTSNIVIRVSVVMLALGLVDYCYQRWQYLKDLKMTKQEVKEEHKQSEGNPQIKSRIRSIQRSLARQRMMSSVPKSTVVITNPTHYAVALLYDSQMEAPKVVAKGMNLVARKIIKIARQHGISIVQNPPLARALYSQVSIEETIPVSLYKAVAKVLAYIYQQKRNKQG